MNENNTINVASVVAPVLASRDVISTLKREIEKNAAQQVQLDFADVEFVSRSAAHELLRLKEQLLTQEKKQEVEFTNANDEVSQMLRTVASNRAMPKQSAQATPLKTVSINDLESSSPLSFLRRLFAH
jgi:anti-anti-sigma regulatory factor